MATKTVVKLPRFNFAPCVCCHICEQACPVSAITLDVNGIDQWKNLYPRVHRSKCIGCGICSTQCPVGSIEMFEA